MTTRKVAEGGALLTAISRDLGLSLPTLRLISGGDVRRLVDVEVLARQMDIEVQLSPVQNLMIGGFTIWIWAIPLSAPRDAAGIAWPVSRHRVGSPVWSLALPERDHDRASRPVIRAVTARLPSIVRDYGDPLAFASHAEPNSYDDPAWVEMAETQGYCLVAGGRRDAGLAVLSDLADATIPASLDSDDRAIWARVIARSQRSLELSRVHGALEAHLQDWADDRIRELGLVSLVPRERPPS